jgi:putative DNA methylase
LIPKKKLIEVALPLEAINKASVRENYIYRGNPSSLHKWWAQRPLAAARAVIFAQMVDDPSAYVDVLRADPKLRRKAESALKARLKVWEEARVFADKAQLAGLPVAEPGPAPSLDDTLADQERQRLFRIIEELVVWENTTNDTVLQSARDEIWQSWRRACAENADHPRATELFDRKNLPAFHDPFAGGGALPLEAQRLGLESYASDLNPVAVLINKAMIEIPPKWAGTPPVNLEARAETLRGGAWHGKGAEGLAEDIRHYGKWMRDEAEKRIGHLYPKMGVTPEMAKGRPDIKPYVGQSLTVIAWLWARTVKSPNPAFAHLEVPLASTFMLSTKPGKEVYVQPVIENGGYRFTVETGEPKDADAIKRGTSAGKRAAFKCLMSGTPIPYNHIQSEGQAGRLAARLLAVVVEGKRGRIYLAPTAEMESVALEANPVWKPDCEMPKKHRNFQPPAYGMNNFCDLFTARQIVALTTFSDLVQETRERVKSDAIAAGIPNDATPLRDGGTGGSAYAEAVSIYLAMAADKSAEYGCTIVPWYAKEDRPKGLFARQAVPMVWDYAEVNPLGSIGGTLLASVGIVAGALSGCAATGRAAAVKQLDAVRSDLVEGVIVSTDPPYYDNICYADLSDFFYVWLRRSLKAVFPELFATLAVPKAEELVATPYRHGSKENAEAFFLDGMTKAMHQLAAKSHVAFPVTIYYAFKQSESESDSGTANTGWETFLDAVIRAGLVISGTWPIRTERGARSVGLDTNALASSIILVCRPRAIDAPTTTRRDFVNTLKSELPAALAHLQRGNIAPVDLAQAAIGPGMAVYTRYAKVLDAEGKQLGVHEALALINQTLDEALAEQEGDFDADSRWALTWFEQQGFAEGDYGVAEQLSKSKNTSVAGMVEAGILESKRGKVRLLRPEELPASWDPTADQRLTAWEVVHQLIRVLVNGGEAAAAGLVATLGAKAEIARELAYRLYTLCERKKRPNEALAYNGLVQSWPEIIRLARESAKPKTEQGGLFGDTEE